MLDPADPAGLVGKLLRHDFGEEHGVCEGTVESFDRETGYRVLFNDDKSHDFGIRDARLKSVSTD